MMIKRSDRWRFVFRSDGQGCEGGIWRYETLMQSAVRCCRVVVVSNRSIRGSILDFSSLARWLDGV